MRLEPIHKLALQILAWAALAALSFFFHVVAFVVVIIMFANQVAKFQFVYDNTKDFPYDDESTELYYQPSIPGIDGPDFSAKMGDKREGYLRENLPKGEE
jgi:hypothetical protein